MQSPARGNPWITSAAVLLCLIGASAAARAQDRAGNASGLRVEIEQDDRSVPIRNHEVSLQRKPFDIVIYFPRSGGAVAVRAATEPSIYEVAKTGKPLGGIFRPGQSVAEYDFDKDQNVLLDDPLGQNYWRYDPTDQTHRFSEVVPTSTGFKCRRRVSKFLLSDLTDLAVASSTFPAVYIVFHDGKNAPDLKTSLEGQREYLKISFPLAPRAAAAPAAQQSTPPSRWMAWMLGSRLGIAAALYDAGVAQDAVSSRMADVTSLGKVLGVPVPALPAKTGNNAADAVAIVHYVTTDAGGPIMSALSTKFDESHATLFFLATRTAFLLRLYAPGDSLGVGTADAMDRDGPRVGVPASFWKPVSDKIRSGAPGAEVREAIFNMHEAVSKFLGDSSASTPKPSASAPSSAPTADAGASSPARGTPDRYSLGTVTVAIPPPTGFVEALSRFPELEARFADPSGRVDVLAVHLPTATANSFVPGQDLLFYTRVAVSKATRGAEASDEVFASAIAPMAAGTLLSSEEVQKRALETARQRGATVGQPIELGVSERTAQWITSITVVPLTVGDRKMNVLTSASVLHLKQRLMYVFACQMFETGQTIEPEKLNAFTKDWVRAIFAANR